MGLAVNQDGASAAATLATTKLRRVIADTLAQRCEQAVAPIDEHRDLAAVVAELQWGLRHCQAPTPSSRRRKCTPATSRRYHALAIGSVAGEVPSAAAATAAAMPVSSRLRPSSARSAALARIAVG